MPVPHLEAKGNVTYPRLAKEGKEFPGKWPAVKQLIFFREQGCCIHLGCMLVCCVLTSGQSPEPQARDRSGWPGLRPDDSFPRADRWPGRLHLLPSLQNLPFHKRKKGRYFLSGDG